VNFTFTLPVKYKVEIFSEENPCYLSVSCSMNMDWTVVWTA
jgi:hypothetical protein